MPSSQFGELSRERCLELLSSHHAGRVAWNAADGPLVLPVTYAMYTNDVVFRTSPYGALSTLTSPTKVAFEIDEVDEQAGTGWSVLVRGRAQAVRQEFDLTTLWQMEGIVPWATGTRNLFIAITPDSITGRTVQAPYADRS
jgi:uncharacterized protein